MAKGYWIATISIRSADGYAEYQAAVRKALDKYGGRYLIRGGKAEIREGRPRPRVVVMEFDDYATAVACYESPEFTAAKAMRQQLADTDFIIVEGWDGQW
ncbi:MAG: DUF1330 domain-containing protein [Hyphomicrobiaceae bacterium]